MSAPRNSKTSLLKQPKAVWTVAFACVISFMGIGLVDPILPALASGLSATPAQVSLLFTSYLVVTAIAMLGVGWVSSRIGSKWALIVGLALIVVFAALAGASGTIDQIIGFRGGWGLGNALFIATSLAVIVASAKGGFSGAIILYEAALGLGIAVGPLVGGLLGNISWRGPFFGVAVLMGIALLATLIFIPKTPKPVTKTSLVAPLAALRHRGLLTMGLVALLYNWGFFTMLGFAPYPMKLDALQLGFVFTGWGLLVAAFAVFVAPRLQRRFGTAAVLYTNLFCLGIVMIVIALGVHEPTVVIVAVIISGAFIGVNNTLTTQAVMLVSPVERSVASSAYGFVRFIGGGMAPFVAGKLAEGFGAPTAFAVGAAAFLIAIPILASGHKLVKNAERVQADESDTPADALNIVFVGETTELSGSPIVAAIDSSTSAAAVIERALALAVSSDTPLDIVHVRETDIIEELEVTPESAKFARDTVRTQLTRAKADGVSARGVLLTTVGGHADVGRALARHAANVGASTIVIGHSDHSVLRHLIDADLTAELRNGNDCEIVLVNAETEVTSRLLDRSK